jgi:hypothetical protein
MVTADGETLAEIADRLGRPLTTVRNTWTRDPDWPEATGKRGRWNVYDPAQVDAWVSEHVTRPLVDLEPNRLYTAQQLEATGIGITAGTIRADRTRGRWPEPDDTTGGVNRWYGRTAAKALEKRRGYRRGAEG